MIRRTYFAEVRETSRKHENSKKAAMLGVPLIFVEGHCTSTVNLHYTRAVAFNKKCKNSQNVRFFQVCMFAGRFTDFCKKQALKHQKTLTFKKKLVE